jgi:hypothetical protein
LIPDYVTRTQRSARTNALACRPQHPHYPHWMRPNPSASANDGSFFE